MSWMPSSLRLGALLPTWLPVLLIWSLEATPRLLLLLGSSLNSCWRSCCSVFSCSCLFFKKKRLKENATKSKPIIKLAQELVAKKWGVLQEDKDLGSMTMKQYMDMYNQHLNEESIEAIEKLTEVAIDKKSKKVKKKKKKGKESLNSAAEKQEKKKGKKVRILR
jgi:hypothetical protein